jgi:hypothetical protein
MSTLDLKNVQGDILLDGLPKRVESFFFFQIADGHVKDFCRSLEELANDISHVDNTAQMRQDIRDNKPTGKEGDLIPMAGANISFSWKGLQKVHKPKLFNNDVIAHQARWLPFLPRTSAIQPTATTQMV